MVRLIRWLLVALCLAAGPAAAQTTCGTLSNCATASTPLGGAELMYIVQGGVSKKIASGTFLGQAAGVVLPLAATTKLYGGSGIAGTAAVVSVGTGLTLSAGTLSVNTAQSLATLSVSGSTTLAAVSATSLSVSGTSTLAATNITGAMTFNGSLTDTPTHQFYTSGGANIQRLSDRVLVGGAVNGGYAGTSTSNTDWWDTVESSLHGSTVGADAVYAQFVSTFDNASVNGGLAVPQIAIAGAVHSLGGVVGTTPRAIEYATYADNNSASISVWGLYGEANYVYGTGINVYGFENEVRAWNPVATAWTPYTTSGSGLIGQEFGCGSGRSATYSCTAAMYISANPNTFGVGLLFLTGSVGQLATGGTTIAAIEMPNSYQIQWYDAGTTLGASIYGDASGNLQINTNGTGGHVFINTQRVYCGSGATLGC